MKRLTASLFALVLFVLILLSVWVFFKDRFQLPGTWKGEADYSASVRVNASGWFGPAAGAEELPLKDMFGDARIDYTLSFSPNGRWQMETDEASYLAMNAAVRAQMAQALRHLIMNRAPAEGKGEITEEEAEAAIQRAIGISSEEYFLNYGPDILPELTSVQTQYSGEGRYHLSGGIVSLEDTLHPQQDGSAVSYRCMVDKDVLVLEGINGNTMIFHRDIDTDRGVLQSMFGTDTVHAAETHRILENLSVTVNDSSHYNVRTIHYSYENNRYISLRDVAYALRQTTGRFSLSIADNAVEIVTGGEYEPVGGENVPFVLTDEDGTALTYSTLGLRINSILIDDNRVKYYSFIGTNDEGQKDCFISVTDLAMMLDMEMNISGGGMSIYTDRPYSVDMDSLIEQGLFYEVNSALVGDATTKEIFTSYMPAIPVPIASTTKLMTCLCVMDALHDGEITLEDEVPISDRAVWISHSSDGMIWMESGQVSNVRELLYGMLLASSNESALALAEYLEGSEEAFVERMNARAEEIGLKESEFFNSNGLPIFTDNISTSKIQNRMSAEDMFTLSTCLLAEYPEVKEITSTLEIELPTLSKTVTNTNPMLYNLPGVIGLKTGTTNMSGACLVAAMETPDADGVTHTIIAIEFGAEDGTVRTTLTEMLLRYGREVVANRSGTIALTEEDIVIPQTAEELVCMVLRKM